MSEPAVLADIERLTKGLEPELIAFRRSLHRHPELARQEHKTTAALVDRLRQAGLQPRVLSSGTGVVCDVIGASGAAPTLGYRGDIDALPLTDPKPVGYRSQVAGACHACGHDVHTTIILGTALVLAELQREGRLETSVRLIFQPAEEVIPGGALDVLADGELEGLEHVFALHCDPKVEVGRLGMRSGPITAGADGLRVTVSGPGGHTARPHLTADLVFALGALVTELPGALSRVCDPRAGLSVVWGQVHAGSTLNAIPQTGFVEGTVRCLDAQVWESAHTQVPDLVRALAAPYGVDVEIDLHTDVPPCVNDARTTELFRSAALAALGSDAVVTTDQSLGGEDFAWMSNTVPGSLARLGARCPEVADVGDLHQATFDVDESVLSVGVRVFSTLAVSDPAD
ncbi:MAG: amidohydrolase [Nocardioidaceae bacterium]